MKYIDLAKNKIYNNKRIKSKTIKENHTQFEYLKGGEKEKKYKQEFYVLYCQL